MRSSEVLSVAGEAQRGPGREFQTAPAGERRGGGETRCRRRGVGDEVLGTPQMGPLEGRRSTVRGAWSGHERAQDSGAELQRGRRQG